MPATCSSSISGDAMADEESPSNMAIENENSGTILIDGDENAANGENGQEIPDPIDLKIRNVVTMFHTCSHIDLRLIASQMCSVVYDRSKGVVEKRLRHPYACVKIWSSGKVILAGCENEQNALAASRSIARLLQKILGPKIKFANYRVTNIMATCRLPFGIKIDQVAREYPSQASYEPELNTGLIWKSVQPKSTVRIHTTGSIIVTGALSSADIIEVLTTLYPILTQFSCQRPPMEATKGVAKGGPDTKRKNVPKVIDID